MKTLALRFVLCAIVATILSVNAAAQTAAGVIKAVRLQGTVNKLTKDGQSVELKNGALLTESDTVITGKNSSVVLVFMNGSTIKLAPESKLAIEEFKMDPVPEDIKVAELEKEPTKSTTSLNLSYGELVGEVKKLNKTDGSTYRINTPVGAAGIRGTTFRIVFRPTGDGKAFSFTLSTAEGEVLFSGTTGTVGEGVSVPQDQQVVVTGEINPATGEIILSAPIATTPLSPEIAALIQNASNEIAQANKDTIISTGEQQSGGPGSNQGGNQEGQRPVPQETPPRTTSGDGR
jgi:hypothetical protein